MRRPRPYIPVEVRLTVARRQARERGLTEDLLQLLPKALAPGRELKLLLRSIFKGEPVDLDHDPPLAARPYNPKPDDVAARFKPNANDPDYLFYRLRDTDHRIKTFVRGEHGQFSDVALIKRERRRNRKPRAKKKIAQRKNFEWPSRPFQRRQK